MLSAMRLRELLSVTVDVFFVLVKLCHVTLLRIRTAKKITADKLTSCGQYIYCFTDAGISCYFSPMCFRSISLKIFFQAAVSVLRSIDVLNTLKSKRRWMKTLSLRTLPFFFTKIANFEAYAIINQKKRSCVKALLIISIAFTIWRLSFENDVICYSLLGLYGISVDWRCSNPTSQRRMGESPWPTGCSVFPDKRVSMGVLGRRI